MRLKRCIAAGILALTIFTPVGRAAEPEAIRAEFKTEDGVTIVGDYYAPMGRAMTPPAILLHMYQNDRATWKPLIEPLHQAGFAVLAIDLRGHGESVGPADMNLADQVAQRDTRVFGAMYKDVEAAVKWVRERPNVDSSKLVLVGASVGCSVAIDYATRDQIVNAIVCLSPGEKYLGLDSTEHITKTREVPILLLATEDERAAVDKLAGLAKNVEKEIVGEGRIHGTRMFGQIKGIEGKIVEFLYKNSFEVTREEQ